MTIILVNASKTIKCPAIVRPEKKLNVSCKLFVNNFTQLKELKFLDENMTEEGLKSRLSSDNPCILTFSIASIFR